MVKRKTYKPFKGTAKKAKGTPKVPKAKKNYDAKAKKFIGFLREQNATKDTGESSDGEE